VRQRQIRNLKNKSQRRRVYATDPSSAKRSIHAKQTPNRPFPSRLYYVYNYIEMLIIWTLFSLLRYKNLYHRLSAANFILGKTKNKKIRNAITRAAAQTTTTRTCNRDREREFARRKMLEKERNVLFYNMWV